MNNVPYELKQKVVRYQVMSTIQQVVFLEKEIRTVSKINNFTIDHDKIDPESEYINVPFGQMLCLDELIMTFYVEPGCKDTVNKIFKDLGALGSDQLLKEDYMYELLPVFKYKYSKTDFDSDGLLYFEIINEYDMESEELPDKYMKRDFGIHLGQNMMFDDVLTSSGLNIVELIENRRKINEGLICYYDSILCKGTNLYSDKNRALTSSIAGGLFFDRISTLLSHYFPIGGIYDKKSSGAVALCCNIPILSKVSKYKCCNPSNPNTSTQTGSFYKLNWYMSCPNIIKGYKLR